MLFLESIHSAGNDGLRKLTCLRTAVQFTPPYDTLSFLPFFLLLFIIIHIHKHHKLSVIVGWLVHETSFPSVSLSVSLSSHLLACPSPSVNYNQGLTTLSCSLHIITCCSFKKITVLCTVTLKKRCMAH